MKSEAINFLYTPDNVKQRMMKLKDKLPHNYRKLMVEKHPEYSTYQGRNLITNVVHLKSSDLRVVELLEEIIEDYKRD